MNTAIQKQNTAIVMPAVSSEEAVNAFNAYQELANKIIRPEDTQVIQGKEFKKKSFWRKCQRFFNLSLALREEKRTEDKNGVFTYKFIFRAIAPNKAYMDGTGTCSSNEKGLVKTEHNTRAIAETRAKNRAIADLVAFGEVSAEEIATNDEPKVENKLKSGVEQVRETMQEHNTQYVDVKCETCGKALTNNQLKWSMDKYNKALCFACQKLVLVNGDFNSGDYSDDGGVSGTK